MSRKPFSDGERRIMAQNYGHRPVNDWGGGDLPAPWASGDVVRLRDDIDLDREFVDRLDQSIRGCTWWQRNTYRHGYFVVSYATSIGPGDEWYFRVRSDSASDRLHVACKDRCVDRWDRDVDFMAPFELIETTDPEGLVRRERMLATGWRPPS